MRKTTSLKTVLRSPLKAMLTFLLIVAASFAMFSRVTDYAVTSRVIKNAESSYHGVAALDNTVPYVSVSGESPQWGDGLGMAMEEPNWPTDEQIEQLSSLPGVTLADTRYVTAGKVEDYKGLIDEENSYYHMGDYVMEGTYLGYEILETDPDSFVDLLFTDVTVLASSDDRLDWFHENPVRVTACCPDVEFTYITPTFPRKLLGELKEGTRCLLIGDYSGRDKIDLSRNNYDGQEDFCVIDGLGDDYLETDDFTYQRELIERIKFNRYLYDIVYTSDMRSIPRFNEHNMVIKGRPLTSEDTEACVVNEQFLETYHLSIGDKVSIQLGDRLERIYSTIYASGEIPKFIDTVELEIVGTYKNMDDRQLRNSESEWCYDLNTVFVPKSLLPFEVPADYTPYMREFSIFVEDAHDIEAFLLAVEPLIEEIGGVTLRFSDGGWLSVKDSFIAGLRTSFMTAALSFAGAVLALFLAVYLYVGRNKKTYAVMRTLGVSGKMARNAIVMPLAVISVPAVFIGGAAGIFYTSKTADAALGRIEALDGFVLDTTLPAFVILLCLLFEILFTLSATLFFLRKMRKTPPLELLQEDVLHADRKAVSDVMEMVSVPAGFDMTKISNVGESGICPGSKYRAPLQVSSYIMRHMRRGIGKAAVSLALTFVLTAGVGMFVMARLNYQDAYYQTEVKGRALNYSFSAITSLSMSDLIKDFYTYCNFNVRINDEQLNSLMVLTNDIEHYLAGSYTVAYGGGYDDSFIDDSARLCLLGREAADKLGVSPGDQIDLMPDMMYSAIAEQFKDDEEGFKEVIQKAEITYNVAGIIESDAAGAGNSVIAVVNSASSYAFGDLATVDYTEFTLSDNDKIEELDELLEEKRLYGLMQAPLATYFIDSVGVEKIQRICRLLDSMFPVAVAASLLIGLFGPGLVILQSAKEAAYLRMLGVTKKRARCMLVIEQVVLSIVGIAVVAAGLAVYNRALFARGIETTIVCFALYFTGCVCGAFAASVQVTRHRILELLQVKE